MNLITAIVIGFFVSLAFEVLCYFMVSNNIKDMKQLILDDIKTIDLEYVFEFLATWAVDSALLFILVNACGVLISIFIAADINFFELVLDSMSYDPLAHLNLTTLS